MRAVHRARAEGYPTHICEEDCELRSCQGPFQVHKKHSQEGGQMLGRSLFLAHKKVKHSMSLQGGHRNRCATLSLMTTLRREAGEDRNAFQNCVWC